MYIVNFTLQYTVYYNVHYNVYHNVQRHTSGWVILSGTLPSLRPLQYTENYTVPCTAHFTI